MGFRLFLNINEYSHDFDFGGYIINYDMLLSDKIRNTKRIFGIVIRPGRVNINGNEVVFNSFEELISNPDFSSTGDIIGNFYSIFELSTKEEIEKYINEQINQ